MTNDLLDQTLLLKFLEGLAGQAAVDLQTVDKGGNGDETVGLDILVQPLGGGLVEDDGVVGLVLDYYSGKSRQLSCSIPYMLCIELHTRIPVIFLSKSVTSPERKRNHCFVCERATEDRLVIITYPCPWTTSSFA